MKKKLSKSELAFWDENTGSRAKEAALKNAALKAFDWDLAANIINEYFKDHKDLYVEAGLQADWDYTGGGIFRDGKPTNEPYTYLSSNWAIPTIILSWDNEEQIELDCYAELNERFKSDSKWDDISLAILGINID